MHHLTDLDHACFLRDNLHQALGAMKAAYNRTTDTPALTEFDGPVLTIIHQTAQVQARVDLIIAALRHAPPAGDAL